MYFTSHQAYALQWCESKTVYSFSTTVSVHHVNEVHQALRDFEAIIQYLPHYSPDYELYSLLISQVHHQINESRDASNT